MYYTAIWCLVKPRYWQKFIKQVLSGMNSVCIMLDDVLITGKDDDEHLCNVEEVF